VEYTFDNAEDAKRGVRIMNQQMADGSKMVLARDHTTPAKVEDAKWLSQHTSAVELRGNAAVAVAAEFGSVGALPGIKATGKGEAAVRIEYANGKPDRVVLREQLSLEGQASVNAGLAENGAGVKVGVAQGTARVSVAMERSFKIPDNVDPAALAADPAGEVRKHARAMAKSEEVKLLGTYEVNATAGGNGGGLRMDFEVSGKRGAVLSPDNLRKVLDGRVQEGLKGMGDNVNVKSSVRVYDQVGYHVPAEVGLGDKVGSVGVEFQATRQRTRWQAPPYQGTGTDFARYVEEQLRRGDPHLADLDAEARGRAVRPD
jgi:hypothetical protein